VYNGQQGLHELDGINEAYSHPTERVSVDSFHNWLRVMYSNLLGHFPKQRHGELGRALGSRRQVELDKKLGGEVLEKDVGERFEEGVPDRNKESTVCFCLLTPYSRRYQFGRPCTGVCWSNFLAFDLAHYLGQREGSSAKNIRTHNQTAARLSLPSKSWCLDLSVFASSVRRSISSRSTSC
jgi:hypothetical protein